MIRGKYTLPKTAALLLKVSLVAVKQVLKYPQIDIPARLNKNGGTVPVSILATLLKIKVKVSAVNNG
jgi:hypothetical protein